jgi:hypothetical protein
MQSRRQTRLHCTEKGAEILMQEPEAASQQKDESGTHAALAF